MAKLDRITVDPNVCLGQPTIRGVRLIVRRVLKLSAGGNSTAHVLEAYPELEPEDVAHALQYAARRPCRRQCVPPRSEA